jgi:Flp pilus assembly protein TadC
LTNFRKNEEGGVDDDDISIRLKMGKREKYGFYFDFLKNPSDVFEQQPKLLILLGILISGFVFLFFHFSSQFVDDFFVVDSFVGHSFIDSFILYFISAESVFIFTLSALFFPYIYFESKHRSKMEFVEEKIPGFLRDLSNLIAGGLTIQEAFSEISKNKENDSFFDDEIRLIGLKMKSGLPFDFCLENFGKRYDSTLIQRAASVISAAEKSGGLMYLSIDAAVFDLQEAVNLKKERDAKQSVYAIVLLISFFLFIGIVLLLIHQFKSLSLFTSQDLTSGVTVDAAKLLYHMLFIQAFFSGLMIGKFKKGKIAAGLKYSFFMIFSVWISFFIGGGV